MSAARRLPWWSVVAAAGLLSASLAVGPIGEAAAQSRPASQPKPEGEMRWALYVTLSPVWFDPGEFMGLTAFWVLYAIHDALVKPMPGNLMTPSLAESWTVSADQRVYEFKLREGLRFHNGALWVSNFNKGTLLRVPVTPAGTAGPIHLVTGGLPNIDDLSFLTPRSDVVFAAQNGSSSQNGPDRVVVIYPNGTYKAVLTSAVGLASPSATAVRGNRSYITDGGVPEPHDPKLQTARINFAALLAHAAH